MQFRIRVSATVVTVSSEDYGRFVPMHFRSRERNDHTVNVRSRERNCIVPMVTFVHYSEPNAEKE